MNDAPSETEERNNNGLIFSIIGVVCAIAIVVLVVTVSRRQTGKAESVVELNEHGVGGLDDPRVQGSRRSQQPTGDMGPSPIDAEYV